MMLSRRRLVQVPSSLCELTALQTLDLSRNSDLNSLPDAISCLAQLQRLDCCSCALAELPDALSCLTALEVLAVSHNRCSV